MMMNDKKKTDFVSILDVSPSIPVSKKDHKQVLIVFVVVGYCVDLSAIIFLSISSLDGLTAVVKYKSKYSRRNLS